ncbi:MAG: hypothetical protein VW397_08825, partial [Candidatus Margulisiibacteriota bacterium]
PVNINFSNQRTVEFHGGNRNGETVSVQGLADSLELHSFLNPNFNAKKDRKTCYFFDIVNSIRYGMDEIFNQILGELTGGV